MRIVELKNSDLRPANQEMLSWKDPTSLSLASDPWAEKFWSLGGRVKLYKIAYVQTEKAIY